MPERLPPRPPRRLQRGEMPLMRIVLLCLLLVAMLVVPLWLREDEQRERRAKLQAQEDAERALASAPASPAAPPSAPTHVNNPDRHGLTFGWIETAAAEPLHASCHGVPRDLAQPHRDSCNPYAGDTSCRTELPVLCFRPENGTEPAALGTATAVAGFLLTARDEGDARCAGAFGRGWRMASFHDGGGWELRAARSIGVTAEQRRRAWVHVSDQRGNCWDPG